MKHFCLTIFIIATCLVPAHAAQDAVAGSPAHLKWMSFWEYDPAGFKGWCNFGFSPELTQINQGARIGLNQFLDVGQLFFVESWAGKGGTWAGYEIRDDYNQCWKACVDLVEPYYTQGYLLGFMMLDEACWNGVTIKELDAATKMVKKTFPNAVVYLNEAGGPFLEGADLLKVPVDYNAMPEGIDWISFDYYGPTAAQVRQWYEKNMYPKMKPHQKALLVPAAYGEKGGEWSIDKWEAYMIDNANAYYAWAKSDPRIIGINPWHWMSYPTGGSWSTGAKDMPKTRARWQEIGKEICTNNSPKKPLPGLTPIQHFDSFGDGEPLPSTYAPDPWGGGKVTPAAPEVKKVAFSTAKAYSGKTSIHMKLPDVAFRYCWGTNDRNTARMFAGSSVQFIEFQVFIDDPNARLSIQPLRGIETPCAVTVDKSGIMLMDANSTRVLAKADVVKPYRWNRIRMRIDIGSVEKGNDDAITVWVNESKVYQGMMTPLKDVVFTTVCFKGGRIYLDDIGMWGEVQ